MKILNGDQLKEVQSLPQIERFVGETIYVIESQDDYAALPADLRAMVEARAAQQAEQQ